MRLGWAATTDHFSSRAPDASGTGAASRPYSTLHGVVFAILCLGSACRRRGAAAGLGESEFGGGGEGEEDVTLIVIAGLDPAIHLLRKNLFSKIDGCPDQVRA